MNALAKLTTLALLGSTVAAHAATDKTPNQNMGGTMQFARDGRTHALPLLKSDYSVTIAGDVATITLRQTFANPGSAPVDATYLFPLNRKAAVHGMEMKVGDTITRAEIQQKQKAQATFDKAKAKGQQAALLTQHRPNMFTQSIANLMPGAPVEITLRYVQTVPKLDDAYELVIPMVVGPRYQGAPKIAQSEDRDAPRTVSIDGWNVDELPAYPPVAGHDAPDTIDADRVGLSITMDAPTGIASLTSATHALITTGTETRKTIALQAGRTIDNRDFVLRYTLGDDTKIAAGALSHYDKRGGFLSLRLEPPKLSGADIISNRELVFVLDTSGSMGGEPMEASRAFMRAALKALRPGDTFRILSFSNATRHMASSALPATPSNLLQAASYVAGLRAGGGTEMNAAMKNAFDTPATQGRSRIVVFLTDGYIGADREVIRTVADRVGNSRIYAFGVGRSVNRFLLEGMAEEGRGYARYVEPGEDAREVGETLARYLKTPVLTDISIDWNGLDVTDPTSTKLPDLFAGGSLRVAARYKTGGKHTIYVEGLVRGRKAQLPIELDLPSTPVEEAATANPLPLIWARERIASLNRAYTLSGRDPKLEEAITKIGLDFSLQSRFTSFVAVNEEIVNPDRSDTEAAQVPLPQASGVPAAAYPQAQKMRRAQRPTRRRSAQQTTKAAPRMAFADRSTFSAPTLGLSGSSTPEPEGLAAIMVLLTLAIARWWRKLRAFAGFGPARKPQRPQMPYRVARDGWWLAANATEPKEG